MPSTNRSALYVALTVLMVLVAFWAVMLAVEYKRDADNAKALTAEIDQLLLDLDAGVDGRSCGILTKSVADGLLGESVERDDVASRQRPGGTEESTPENPQLFWADTCVYESEQNRNIFISLNISTYATSEEALVAFSDVLPVVNDVEILNRANYGDELLYDAGVVYLLKDREIYQLAAQNSNPAMTRELVIGAFNDLVTKFE